MTIDNREFSRRILDWFARHGRTDFPWQRRRTPYRVWVAEIMLQQTQAATVAPYFERFMAQFPTVADLAAADEDAVLHLWTGLGYYTRARNLHRAARLIESEFDGKFPSSVAALEQLPGIGRSTAGAIVAQAFDQPAAIVDGNVKRLLARHDAVEGAPDKSATLKRLWEIAESRVPAKRCREYTQAVMDLGATVCTPKNPGCSVCPIEDSCRARAEGRVDELPHKKNRKQLPVRETQMIIMHSPDARRVLLEKRPPQGIWGGLWSFPEIGPEADTGDFVRNSGFGGNFRETPRQAFRHTFSHYHLNIRPLVVALETEPDRIMENGRWRWYDLDNPDELGLAAPVKKLLSELKEAS